MISPTHTDFSCFAVPGNQGSHTLYLSVEGMVCGSCIWNIETALNTEPHVHARVNLSSRRLALHWQGSIERCNALIEKVTCLGYHLLPFDVEHQETQDKAEETFLLKCLAVAGFASGNIMLFSFALWFHAETMGTVTRDLIHWLSALIALPCIIYAGRPFFRSALTALSHRRTNMDVPIALAIALAALMSLFETFRHGEYVYFDSSVMLLFFLLIGRFLDKKARSKAHVAAHNLLNTFQGTATIKEDGKLRNIAIRDIKEDMVLCIAAGEKIPADGVVISGRSEIDSSLVTGETLPYDIKAGQPIFAGMINLSAPIEVHVTAANDKSMLADMVKLMEAAGQGQVTYIRLADNVARYYTPVVHMLGLATFMFWFLVIGIAWQKALLIATTVLIITCPCALALAVPAVHVLASSRLFRQGVLLKSSDALERLVPIDTIVFDKTGTLTLGNPRLDNQEAIAPEYLQLAASLASQSKHPLSQAVFAAWQSPLLPIDVEEIPGYGLHGIYNGMHIRLGKRSWCGDTHYPQEDCALELWLACDGENPQRLIFSDHIRADAKETIATLQKRGFITLLLSGDRTAVVEKVASTLGIIKFHAETSPIEKSQIIDSLKREGRRVLMVGDGINDSLALAAADVSIAPSSAMDISQNASDIVFQGKALSPIITILDIATCTDRLVKQNLFFSLSYNIIAVPLAVMGHITPLAAAIAMSSSSLIVILNAFRLNLLNKTKECQ